MPSAPTTRERRSIRLPEHDYAQSGAYFVTICTANRELFFNDAGIRQIAEQCWVEMPRHSAAVTLDEWVVMPNHLHGIVAIDEDETSRAFN